MNFIKSTFIASVLCVSSIAQAGSSGDPLNIDRVLVTDSFHTIYFPVETANLEGCGDAKKVSFYREDYAHTSISYPFSTASFTASAAGLNIRHSLSFSDTEANFTQGTMSFSQTMLGFTNSTSVGNDHFKLNAGPIRINSSW